MKAMTEMPYFKLSDNKYNDRLKALTATVASTNSVAPEQLNKFGVFLIENFENAEATVASDLQTAITRFAEVLKEYDGNYLIKDKTGRLECCQALKKTEREKRTKALYEKIKKLIKEKFKLCNLFVKNLPDTFDDN